MYHRVLHATLLGAALILIVLATACRTAPIAPRQAAPVFYPDPPVQPRVQYLRSFTSRKDIGERQYSWVEFLVGPEASAEERFMKPYGLATTPGRFYVCDSIAGTVWAVNFVQGGFAPLAGDQGQGKLKKPINIRIDSDGRRYVTDVTRKQVVVYGPDDQYVAAFSLSDPDLQPNDVAIAGDRLYVAAGPTPELLTQRGGMIEVLDKRTGEHVQAFGSMADSPRDEAAGIPVAVAVDPRGNVLVSDAGSFRILIYSPKGEFLGAFGGHGKQAGQFARPKGIAVDRAGIIYVVDSAFENVQMFDQDLRLLMWFGGPGTGPGALVIPAQVHIDYENNDYFRRFVAPGYDIEYVLWVTSQEGPNLISCYAFLRSNQAEVARQ